MRRKTPLRSTPAASWILVLLLALGVPSTVDAQATDDPQHLEYMVEMRDGVKLATSVYVPEGSGPWPTVLQRTPYNRAGGLRAHERYTDAGYAFVIQDHQGRYGSQGEYVPRRGASCSRGASSAASSRRPREGARGNQKLMMGPIGHGQLRGDLEYPQPRPDRATTL